MSPRTRFSVFYNTVLLWGERRHPHPKLVPGDMGKVGREGRKKMKGQSGHTTSQSHLMLLLWVSPALVVCQALWCRQGLL